MGIFQDIEIVKNFSIAFLIAIVVAFLVVAFMVYEEAEGEVMFIIWALIMITASVFSIIIISNVTPDSYSTYGTDIWSRFMIALLASTLPSTGFLIGYWCYFVGNGEADHSFWAALLVPVVVLVIFAFISVGVLNSSNFVFYYIYEYGIWVIGIGAAIGIRIAFGGSEMWHRIWEKKKIAAEKRQRNIERNRERLSSGNSYRFDYDSFQQEIASRASIYKHFSGGAKHYISSNTRASDVYIDSYSITVKTKVYIEWAFDKESNWAVREACEEIKNSVLANVKGYVEGQLRMYSEVSIKHVINDIDLRGIRKIHVTAEY